MGSNLSKTCSDNIVVSLWINLLKNWATKLIILWQTYLRACKRHLDHPVAADDPTIVSCSSGQFLKCVGTASGALPVVPALAGIGQLVRRVKKWLSSPFPFLSPLYIDVRSTTGGPTRQMIFCCPQSRQLSQVGFANFDTYLLLQ